MQEVYRNLNAGSQDRHGITHIIMPGIDWNGVTQAVETFAAEWEKSPPADLRAAIDRTPDSIRQFTIVELVKIDLEHRWQHGLRRLLEDYFDDVPELRTSITPDLILEEFHARRQAGEHPGFREYTDRFPQFADQLESLFRIEAKTIIRSVSDLPTFPLDEIQVGEKIGDFDLLARLGSGGFAQVFLARQTSMQRLVALKISRNKGNEPQTLAQLDHENIVRVYDQYNIPDRGLRLLYMQYASGGTLADVIEYVRQHPQSAWNGSLYLKAVDRTLSDRGDSPPGESALRRRIAAMTWSELVCWIGTSLSRALTAAHHQGVLHRDLKPSNVLLTSEGLPKLADFNVSYSNRVTGSFADSDFGGSIAYMAPEQMEACDLRYERAAADLDHRCDLFSLAVLLWELLGGERPFPINLHSLRNFPTEEYVAAIHVGPHRPPITSISFQKTPGLDQLLAGCLHYDREKRFPDAAQLAREFDLCLQPDAKRLLSPNATGIHGFCQRHPIYICAFLTFFPNAVAAVFNLLYNLAEVRSQIPLAEPAFMRIQAIINAIAFPLGVCLTATFVWSISRVTHLQSVNPEKVPFLRALCLNLGNLAAGIGLSLWIICGTIYPIALRILYGPIPGNVYISFIGSLALCGMIAASYPFFAIASFSVRYIYPLLLLRITPEPGEDKGLERLAVQSWGYLLLAASMPLIAVAILALTQSEVRGWLLLLAFGGVLGFGLTVLMFRYLQADIATLRRFLHTDRN